MIPRSQGACSQTDDMAFAFCGTAVVREADSQSGGGGFPGSAWDSSPEPAGNQQAAPPAVGPSPGRKREA
jgi:hypothetical protein